MIDAWHLTWIVPAVAALSFCFGAMLATGKACDAQAAKETENEHDGAWPSGDKCAECPFRPNDEIV